MLTTNAYRQVNKARGVDSIPPVVHDSIGQVNSMDPDDLADPAGFTKVRKIRGPRNLRSAE